MIVDYFNTKYIVDVRMSACACAAVNSIHLVARLPFFYGESILYMQHIQYNKFIEQNAVTECYMLHAT